MSMQCCRLKSIGLSVKTQERIAFDGIGFHFCHSVNALMLVRDLLGKFATIFKSQK